MEGSNIYADESCQNKHQYMVLGGVVVEIKELHLIRDKLIQVKNDNKITSEMKWGKVSKAKYNVYLDYVNCFFEAAEKEIIHFHSVTVDTSKVDHKKYKPI